MIARIWFGRTRLEDADAYGEYMNATGVEAQRRTPGNRGSMILRRDEGDESEFIVFSLWESLDAVRAFAGERPEVAIYFPEDESYLLELAPEVSHYEVSVYEVD